MVLKPNFSFEDELASNENIDPSPGNRSIFEVDEVLESEQLDDEIEAKLMEGASCEF